MLAMQASNLEQQERLFKKQIRLGLREILQQEMGFYITAFHNINTCGSVLAGFAFSGLLLSPYDGRQDDSTRPSNLSQSQSKRLAIIFNGACCATCCLSLLTLIYANYLGLFSTRLALRGGDQAVEHTVTRLRREYKVVLHLLTCSVLCFLLILPVLSFMKMEKTDTIFVTLLAVPAFILVVVLYNRARRLFYLNKEDRFAKSRGSGDGTTKGKHIDLAGSWADSDSSFHQHALRKSLLDEEEGDDGSGPESIHHKHSVFNNTKGKVGWGHLDGRNSDYSDVGTRFSKQFLDENSGYGSGGAYNSGQSLKSSLKSPSSSNGKRHPDYYRGYVEGSLSSRPVEEDKADYLRGFVEGSLTAAPPEYGPHYPPEEYQDDTGGRGHQNPSNARGGRSQTAWSFLGGGGGGGPSRRHVRKQGSADENYLSDAFDGRSGNRKWRGFF